jgi:co-chaperonin GroES (HSP10)
VFEAPRGVIAVEQVQFLRVVAVQLGGDEQSRREDAVHVVVGDDVVFGADTDPAEQLGEGLGAG